MPSPDATTKRKLVWAHHAATTMAAVAMYRALLRCARLHDRDPRLNVLLGPIAEALAHETAPVASALQGELLDFLGPSGRYVPGKGAPSPSAYLRKRVRAPGSPETMAALATALESAYRITLPVLSGARAQRTQFGDVTGVFREARRLRRGTLIVENASGVDPGRGVYLILDITPLQSESAADASSSSSGTRPPQHFSVRALCINRPMPQTVADALPDRGLTALSHNFVFFGGSGAGSTDDGVYVVHPVPGVTGSEPLFTVADLRRAKLRTEESPAPESVASPEDLMVGLYAGGSMSEITALIEDGDATANDFKVVSGSQVFTYSTATDQILELPGSLLIEPAPSRELAVAAANVSGLVSLTLAPAMLEAPPESIDSSLTGWYNHHAFFHQDAVWADVMSRVHDPSGTCRAVSEVPQPAVLLLVQALSARLEAGQQEEQ